MSLHDIFSREALAWMLGLSGLYTIVEHVFRLRFRRYVRSVVSSAGMGAEHALRLKQVVAVRERLENVPRSVRWIEATLVFFLWAPYVSGPWYFNSSVFGLASNVWLLFLVAFRWIAKRRSEHLASLASWPAPHG